MKKTFPIAISLLYCVACTTELVESSTNFLVQTPQVDDASTAQPQTLSRLADTDAGASSDASTRADTLTPDSAQADAPVVEDASPDSSLPTLDSGADSQTDNYLKPCDLDGSPCGGTLICATPWDSQGRRMKRVCTHPCGGTAQCIPSAPPGCGPCESPSPGCDMYGGLCQPL